MKRQEILNMPAGKKMNQLIWWKIFDMFPTPPNNDMNFLPDYSGDMNVAWSVLEKHIKTSGSVFNPFVEKTPKGFACSFDGINYAWECDTAPLAICRAALLIVSDGDEMSRRKEA